MLSFSDMGRKRGFKVTSRGAALRRARGDPGRGRGAGVAPGSQVCDLARIRFFDGVPIADTQAIVPDYLAPGLVGHDFAAQSLYDVLRAEYRVMPGRGKFAIQAAAASPAGQDRLDIGPGDPVLIFQQTGYDQLGRAFELARTVYRADRYLFRGTLVAVSEGTAPVVRETR